MTQWTKRELDELENNPNDYGWDDLRVPMQNTRINPAKSEPAFEAWIDGIFAYHFDAANDNDASLHFSAQLPHSWAEGTELRPHIHWAPSTAAAGDVVWELDYIICNIGEAFAASASTLTVTDAAAGVANQHQTSSFGSISGKGVRISAMLICRLTRLGDDGDDDYGADAIALEFDIHYRKDSDGSYHESYKLSDEYRKLKGKVAKPYLPGAW